MNERDGNKNSAPVSDQVADQRMKGAGLRAIECHQRVASKAARLIEEMEDLTPVHGVPIALSEDDSVVTAISNVLAANTKR